MLPMLNLQKAISIPLIRELLGRRIDLQVVFEDDKAIDELIAASGGCLRDLMFLVRRSCSPEPTISTAKVRRAITGFQQTYDMLLNESDVPILDEVLRDRTIDRTGPGGLLLDKRIVLEYRNDRRWVGVHPAVADAESFKIRLDRYRRRIAESRESGVLPKP